MKIKSFDKNQCSRLVVVSSMRAIVRVVVVSRYGVSSGIRNILRILSLVSDI